MSVSELWCRNSCDCRRDRSKQSRRHCDTHERRVKKRLKGPGEKIRYTQKRFAGTFTVITAATVALRTRGIEDGRFEDPGFDSSRLIRLGFGASTTRAANNYLMS